MFENETLAVMFRQCAQLGIIAIGQTMVMLVAGLDLSIGGVIVMTSMVVAEVSNGRNEMIPFAILIALIVGMIIGLCNGLLITIRKVPPLVATLVMLFLVQGVQQALTRGVPSGFVPESLGVVNKSWGFISIPLLIWIILNGLFLIILRRTSYGRRIFAVGSNPEAARLNGLPVNLIKISVYVLSSILAVISGVILTGYVGYVDRFIATGLDLDSIAAAVVGGTSFFGGKAKLIGTIAGVLIIQILSTMVVLIGLDIETQFIIKGLIILAAVSLYSIAQKNR
ncbi:MAG TPA: ABC transporter permease [Candidatus Lambdaproteobacteria bacterium]|nr:ABC transporter permease [Candidatus Lambdaproteobacteria bacterium]|tara:strand:+ start:1 stop:846 length:846 start_codon:yes stop_codon:yes gene_type:complete